MDCRISLALSAAQLPQHLHSKYSATINAKLKQDKGLIKLTVVKFMDIQKTSSDIHSYLSPDKSYIPYAVVSLICAVASFASSFFALGAVCLSISFGLCFHKLFELPSNENKLCEAIAKHIHDLTLFQIFQEILIPQNSPDQGIGKLVVCYLIERGHDSYLSQTPTIQKTPQQIKNEYSDGSQKRDDLIADYNIYKDHVNRMSIAILFI